MEAVGTFPFGEPIRIVTQSDRTKKRVFVLGVYASAVHARWVAAGGGTLIKAVGVASEPEIFWNGEGAEQIIEKIPVPAGAGRLVAPEKEFNGPSGRALDELYLAPLGLARADAWLCDLVPHSCSNERQRKALHSRYHHRMEEFGLPDYNWPSLPFWLTDEQRRADILAELQESGADTIITLGDQPLKYFTKFFGSAETLASFGTTAAEYGRPHDIRIGDRPMKLLPLVHPRQAAGLGLHLKEWQALHAGWVGTVPKVD
jgi:hypothetical protein